MTTPQTPQQIASRVLELDEKAPREEWMTGGCCVWIRDGDMVADLSIVLRDPEVTTVYSDLIAEYRTAAPELARAVIKLESDLAAMREENERLKKEVIAANHRANYHFTAKGVLDAVIGERDSALDQAEILRKKVSRLIDERDALAKHGADFMRLHLAQAILIAEIHSGDVYQEEDLTAIRHRISEMSCELADAQKAFENITKHK